MLYNNLAELRLFFALCVVISHAVLLADIEQLRMLQVWFSSDTAVQAFFILSGFLVMKSFERSANAREFYLRRAGRVFPAYFTAVLFFFVVCLVYAAFAGRSVGFGESARYLAANLSLANFLHPTLGTLFQDQVRPEINGALWTIKVEVGFYLLVPLLFFFGKRWSFRGVGILLICAGLAWRPILLALAQNGYPMHASLDHQLPGQLQYFGLGMVLYWAAMGGRRELSFGIGIALGAALLAWALGDIRSAIQIVALFLLIVAAIHLPQLPGELHKRDLSYGIYLAHFPIIQLLVSAGTPALSWWLYFALVFILSTLFALVCWRFVEKPALAAVNRVLS